MDFPYGTIVNDIPPEFVPVEMWPEYGYITGIAPICKRELVDGQANVFRWSIWPITFEQHFGDFEPNLERSQKGELARNRLIIWLRIRKLDVPYGWSEAKTPFKIDGFRLLNQDTTSGWHKNARRDLRLWQERHENHTHVIQPIEIEEYAAAYKKSLVAKRLDKTRMNYLRRKLAHPLTAQHTRLWGIRNVKTGEIVAGTALIHSPTYRGSTHFAPFILEEGRHIFAATALMHHWFSLGQNRGDKFVITTNFWFPGKPKDWKGFSEFKSHFGWHYVAYPPELTRFVRGRLF